VGKNKLRVLVLGAGFGGLEIAATLSERIGDSLDLILIDKNESFYFGYSKLDVMFGRKSANSVKHSYSLIKKPGVQFRQETITSIDPVARRVTTRSGAYTADVLVIALGADYNIGATPGLAEAGYEFYTFEGAERVRDMLPTFIKGHVIVGVCSFPFKCPPAPSETALLLNEFLVRRGVRKNCEISLVVPFELPIPPSYGTSKALLKAFRKKGINYIPDMMVGSIDANRKVAELDDGREMPFDLFLGIPEHCVPGVVEESGLVYDEWIQVDRHSMLTHFPHVYAIGDVANAGIPKSGSFAVGAARSAAESIIAKYEGQEFSNAYNGVGSCYVEFGEGKVGRADVDFFSKPYATGIHRGVSRALAKEKRSLGERNKARWFGLGEGLSFNS
jgi:sulfide:quinone oxidoreductase